MTPSSLLHTVFIQVLISVGVFIRFLWALSSEVLYNSQIYIRSEDVSVKQLADIKFKCCVITAIAGQQVLMPVTK